MRNLVLTVAALLLLTACPSGTPFQFVSAVYESTEDEQIWLDVRAEDREVVFYDADGATVDADGHVQSDELHRDTMDILTQEERGEMCGDDLWYEAAMLDDMLMFQLHTLNFTWPTLVWDCDQEHLILSDDELALDCSGDETCVRFAPID